MKTKHLAPNNDTQYFVKGEQHIKAVKDCESILDIEEKEVKKNQKSR